MTSGAVTSLDTRRWTGAWCRWARRPRTAAAAVAALALALMAAIAAAAGVPEPEVHDELTMVVMADIFAQGHLCEPTHPHWQHFEANYMLAHPCTQGKYPAGPPLFMAIGRVLTGEFIAGVWLSVVVMILAAAYAMYGWLPPRWALLGTILVALRFGIAGDWTQSYWGGSLAAAGGALVFGAAARLTTAPALRDAALLGTGLSVLALSRPYEGLACSLPALALIAVRLIRHWPGRGRLWRALPAAAATAAAGLGWMAFYNASVTGSALVMPYTLYERTHSSAPLFVFQDFRPAPEIRNAQMAGVEQYHIYEARNARARWPINKLPWLALAIWDFLKPTLLVAVLGLGAWRWRRARSLALWSTAVIFVAVSLASPSTGPRYLAPATVPIFLLVTLGLASLAHRRFGPVSGRLLAVGALVLFGGAVAAAAVAHIDDTRRSADWWAHKRDIRERLEQSPEEDLVFVRYGPGHSPHQEWVYNLPSIDSQPVVWARELGPHADTELRRYFGRRQAWVVEVDARPPRLVPWQDQQVP